MDNAEERTQNFGQVPSAFTRIIDAASNEKLIRYDLGEDFSIETAIVAGELYRHNRKWKLTAIGSSYQDGLTALVQVYGLDMG
ncbi:TerD family protein [Enterococcus sp. BWB1-3]|uniref:TerD family protein n=1 Tax=Enterococcus sp. BWB1-3 TaxID=2787713 RepID=UPI0019222C54|nr:TerD family protein [Enterococcus sp. BWB1-3]